MTSPALANGRLGWVADERVRLFSVGYEIRVRISRREAVVLRGHRALFRFTVAVGRAATPTPLGRFAVTDKLRIRGTASYGCCALPISGRQPNLPQGWGGGDRLAIHGTSDPASIGGAVSMGCLRASDQALRRLLVTVPLGTPVIVSG
ncbi:MAG: hypothetical protein QOK31_2160 [Solirubrobacteraceae bacterium]|nr:hypothetical protein [Solirubrobacteraceae bacterium]